MTGRRISELAAAAAPLTLRELLPAVQDGTTSRLSLEQVRGGRILSLRDFGAVGDGVADDTAAFRAIHGQLRDEQQRDPDLRALIVIPPGHYRYSWNRWLWGLRNVTVDGYGARLQCVAASKWNLDKFPLVTNRNGFQGMGLDDNAEPRAVEGGCLIDTAPLGAGAVRLKNADEAARFLPGRYVLVMSYDQQFAGYPPNCRFFDYARVAGVDGPVVTLDRPLRHEHRDDCPELAEDSIGRARVVDIDRDDVPFAVNQTLCGLTFLPNPNIDEASAQYLLAQGVYSFAARDCAMQSFIPSIGHDFTVENCAIDYSEPDKLSDSVTFRGCRIGALTQATGVNLLTLSNCALATKANVQARVITFDGCSFNGGAQPGEYQRGVDMVGFAPIRTVSITNSTFYGKNGETDAAVGPVGTPGNGFTVIPLGPPLRLVAGRVLAIPRADKRAQALLRSVDLGDYVWIGGQAGGDVFCDGRHAVVEKVTSSETDVLVSLSLSGPVTPNDTLIVPRTQRFRSTGNAYQNLRTPVPVSCDSTFESIAVHSEQFSFRLASDFAQETRNLCGYLHGCSVRVLRPYTGADAGAFLRIEQVAPANPSFLISIDLRQAGLRRVGLGRRLMATPADSLMEPSAHQFVWSVRLSHAQTANGRSAAPAGSGVELADYLLSFDTENPFRLRG